MSIASVVLAVPALLARPCHWSAWMNGAFCATLKGSSNGKSPSRLSPVSSQIPTRVRNQYSCEAMNTATSRAISRASVPQHLPDDRVASRATQANAVTRRVQRKELRTPRARRAQARQPHQPRRPDRSARRESVLRPCWDSRRRTQLPARVAAVSADQRGLCYIFASRKAGPRARLVFNLF